MGINKLASACVDSKHVSTGSSVQHLLMLKKIPASHNRNKPQRINGSMLIYHVYFLQVMMSNVLYIDHKHIQPQSQCNCFVLHGLQSNLFKSDFFS